MQNVRLNVNGDTAQTLLAVLQAAYAAVNAAEDALNKLVIHGRNYQTCENPQDAYMCDVLAKRVATTNLLMTRDWLLASYEHITAEEAARNPLPPVGE